MAPAVSIHQRTLRLQESKLRPGLTPLDLAAAAARNIRSEGATPAFKGYRGFPGSLCTSPNEMVVHGIPGPYELKRGDVISVDCGVVLDGWVADAARTFTVGGDAAATPIVRKLLDTTKQSLFDAVPQCTPGNHLGDVSNAVQTTVEAEGLSIVRSLVGHGIGRSMHEDPQIPNYGSPGKGPELKAGMALAIEPMVNVGGHEVEVLDDAWTVVTTDGTLSAHFEHTVAITDVGPQILTDGAVPE
jgi:methionyl aminopeptidase